MKIERNWNEDQVTTDLMNEMFIALDGAVSSGDMTAEIYGCEDEGEIRIMVGERRFELRLVEVV